LANGASLIDTVEHALEALSDNEQSTLNVLTGVGSKVRGALQFDPALAAIDEALEAARIHLQEAVSALRRYREGVEIDPAQLRELERRLEAVHDAARKFRVPPEALPAMLQERSQRLTDLQTGLDPAALSSREGEAQDTYLAGTQTLSARRRAAAAELATSVSATMQSLAMTGGSFEVALEALAEGNAHGLEAVEFRVAPHAGAASRPLAKIASGGELSRLSLAIQTATSSVARVPTLVFDEVDAGIGGRVAEIVGRMLQSLGAKHQVMCITHLPQVAASADHQWQVSKTESDGVTRSLVKALAGRERIDEIARMLGGVNITQTSRKHAAEMLGVKS
jgi:DNA repair protein RecN (Recombination protein N)